MEGYNEKEVADDYPIFVGYFYIADDEIVRAGFQGQARRLKMKTGAKVIKTCDMYGRKLDEDPSKARWVE